jgi:hypothetical protein
MRAKSLFTESENATYRRIIREQFYGLVWATTQMEKSDELLLLHAPMVSIGNFKLFRNEHCSTNRRSLS